MCKPWKHAGYGDGVRTPPKFLRKMGAPRHRMSRRLTADPDADLWDYDPDDPWERDQYDAFYYDNTDSPVGRFTT